MEATLHRGSNRALVLAELLAGTPIVRAELVARTGLSQATVFRIVDDLMAEGLCVEGGPVRKEGPGRTAAAIKIAADAGLVCGVDLGGTKCRFVIGDLTGTPRAWRCEQTPRSADRDGLADWIAIGIRTTIVDAGLTAPLLAAALGLPGLVGQDQRTVCASRNLGQIVGTGFTDRLAREIPAAVTFENDSTLGLLGEMRYGIARGKNDIVMLTLGTGIGSGLALGGQLVTGRTGLMGEFGRLRMPGGPRLRRLLSGAGLVRESHARGFDVASARDVFESADERAISLVGETRAALTHLLNIVALAYEPELIVLAGGYSATFPPELLAQAERDIEADLGLHVLIRHSKHTDHIGLLGALAAGTSLAYRTLGVPAEVAAGLPDDDDLIRMTWQALAS